MLIAIEGADAVGKATQTAKLAERFRDQGRRVVQWSFPQYNLPTGKLISKFLRGQVQVGGDVSPAEKAMMLQALFTVDRYDMAEAISHAAYREDEENVVIVDRWWPSGIYGLFDGLIDYDWLVRISSELPRPDHFVLLDVPFEVSRQRRPDLRDMFETNEAMQRFVREAYKSMWANPPLAGSKWHMIDGTGTPDEVHDLIWEAVFE